MCLTGFVPAEHAKVFDALEAQKEIDSAMLIGNAMHVPVVGVVAACAISIIDPPPHESGRYFKLWLSTQFFFEVVDDTERS